MERYPVAMRILVSVFVGGWFLLNGGLAQALTREEVMSQLDQWVQLREGLALSLVNVDSAQITADTFQNVCAPVGKSIQEWSKKTGLEAKQWALKFRNPNNEPKGELRAWLSTFEKNPELTHAVFSEKRGDQEGQLYLRRISVTEGCLKCHGPKDERPEFIRKKYPQDQAYGFKAGDFRGVLSVWVKN
jgi:hypothetical protein